MNPMKVETGSHQNQYGQLAAQMTLERIPANAPKSVRSHAQREPEPFACSAWMAACSLYLLRDDPLHVFAVCVN